MSDFVGILVFERLTEFVLEELEDVDEKVLPCKKYVVALEIKAIDAFQSSLGPFYPFFLAFYVFVYHSELTIQKAHTHSDWYLFPTCRIVTACEIRGFSAGNLES